jgi:hypothetical protein
MKKIWLAIGILWAFTIGYGSVAEAYPSGGVWGRAEYRGYFSNIADSAGTNVLPANYSGEAFPSTINSADEFIAFIDARIGHSNQQLDTGAAFIVNTMQEILAPGDRTPSSTSLANWRNIVRTAANHGHVNWRVNFSYSLNSYYQGPSGGGATDDDAFYDDSGTFPAMTFEDEFGRVAYAIKWQCANPVVFNTYTLEGFWDITGSTYGINGAGQDTRDFPPGQINTYVGDTLNWTHEVENLGPSFTNPTTVDVWTAQTIDGAATWSTITPRVDRGVFAAGASITINDPPYVVPNYPVGTNICRSVFFNPTSSISNADARSAAKCAMVQANYNLSPTVTVNQTTADEGDTVTFSYRIENTATSASAGAACNSRDGSGAVVPVALTCNPGPQTFPGSSGVVTVGTENIVISGQPAGTRICRRLTVTPATQAGNTATSVDACVIVAKTPYVNFMGGDVWAGGGFARYQPACNTSAKITTVGQALGGTAPTQYAGSVVEYQAFALNRVRGFGSSSRPLVAEGGFGSSGRRLTYANSDSVDVSHLGYYGAASHCIIDYIDLFWWLATPIPGSNPVINVGTQPDGIYVTSSGNLHLTGTMRPGSKQVYIAQFHTYIDGDIRYPDSYANVNDIPNLVVISAFSDIYVAPTVSRMDGLYVADGDGISRGFFRTCWPKPATQAAGDACDQRQLVINGTVLAANLDLARSFGASGGTVPQRQTAAEVFNFSPELYLRNALSGNDETTVQTTNVLELPPRF